MEKPAVREFVEFYLQEGGELATEVKYMALPDEAYRQGDGALRRRQRTGTVFGGVPEVGLKIEELLERELKS